MIADLVDVESPSVVTESEEPLQRTEEKVAPARQVLLPEPLLCRYEVVKVLAKGCRDLRIPPPSPVEFAYIGQMTRSEASMLLTRIRERTLATESIAVDQRKKAEVAELRAAYAARAVERKTMFG